MCIFFPWSLIVSPTTFGKQAAATLYTNSSKRNEHSFLSARKKKSRNKVEKVEKTPGNASSCPSSSFLSLTSGHCCFGRKENYWWMHSSDFLFNWTTKYGACAWQNNGLNSQGYFFRHVKSFLTTMRSFFQALSTILWTSFCERKLIRIFLMKRGRPERLAFLRSGFKIDVSLRTFQQDFFSTVRCQENA